MKRRVLTVCLLLVLACAGSGDASSTTGQPGSTATTVVPNAVADGCMVGSWILDRQRFVASFEATLRATGRTAEVSATSGSATISIEENGLVAGIFEDFTVQTEFGEDSEPIEMVFAGAIVGTWSVQENKFVLAPDLERTTFEAQSPPIEITDTGNSGTYYLEVGPESQALARSYPVPIGSASPSIITCQGDTLTIGPERGRSATVWLRS